MNSPSMNDPHFDERTPFPRPGLFGGLLWAAPVGPGLYGEGAFEGLLMTTNHRPTLARLGAALAAHPVGVLAMEAGGLPPKMAVALGLVADQAARRALRALPTSLHPDVRRVLIPQGLAHALGWQDQPKIENFPIQVISDDLPRLGEYFSDPELEVTPDAAMTTSAIVLRLLSGQGLWLGQALIFAMPLLLFGWRSLLWGIASLWVGTLALALFWRMLPGTGWLKGLIAGAALALIVGLGSSLMTDADWIERLRYSLALWIATAWMGWALTGARHK